MRIGKALVDAGIISEEQLIQALRLHEQEPGRSLGEVVAKLFGIPVEKLDELNVRSVLLPRFRKLLLTRLLTISRGDKFAKGLDVTSFITGITTLPESFVVQDGKWRRYTFTNGVCECLKEERGFITVIDVLVTLKTASSSIVEGRLGVRHDSRVDRLEILDDDTHVRESIYYGLRSAYKSSS